MTLRKSVRIAVVLSTLWLFGVAAFVAVDWLQVLPGHCQLDQKASSRLQPVERVFFFCNAFSDIPTSWWGTHTLHIRNQVIEVRTWLLAAATFPPLIAIWLTAVLLAGVWSWVVRGK